jgi:hypothetical protein
MRVLLIVALLIVSAPLCATPAPSHETYAVLGELADRLLRLFEQPERRLTPSLSLKDLVEDRSEIAGSNCDASNYGLKVVSIEPPVVWIIYRPRHDYQPRGNYVVVDLAARTRVFADKPAPDGVGEFPFPPDDTLDAQREWERTSRIIRAVAFAAWWCGVVIWTFASGVLVLGARRVDRKRQLRAAIGSGNVGQSALLMSEVQQLAREDRAALAALGMTVLFIVIWSQIGTSVGGIGIGGWALIALVAVFFATTLYSLWVNGCSTRRSFSLALSVITMALPGPWAFAIMCMHTPPGIALELAVPTAAVAVCGFAAWLRRRVWRGYGGNGPP